MAIGHVPDHHAIHRHGNRDQRGINERKAANAPNAERLHHAQQNGRQLMHQGDGTSLHRDDSTMRPGLRDAGAHSPWWGSKCNLRVLDVGCLARQQCKRMG